MKIKINNRGDFDAFKTNPNHPIGKNVKEELNRMPVPLSYPVVITFDWEISEWTDRNYISYDYVYPSDFEENIT